MFFPSRAKMLTWLAESNYFFLFGICYIIFCNFTHCTLKFARNFDDRQGGIVHAWSASQFVGLNVFFLERSLSRQSRQTGDPSPQMSLQIRSDFLWLHACLGRGQDARNRQFADLFCYELETLGPSKAVVAATITCNGKMNSNGRAEWLVCLRHKNPILCAQGAQAFDFFVRYHVDHLAPPDFSRRENWYEIPVLRSPKEPNNPISYKTQYNYISKALTHVGIHSTNKVHIGRSQGAANAALSGFDQCFFYARKGNYNL